MADRPMRVQLSRRKGWRLPENAVKVDRSTKWGNPFVVNTYRPAGAKLNGTYTAVPTVEDAVECYRLWLAEVPDAIAAARSELAGHDLACWCHLDQPCHADVLLEIANGPIPDSPAPSGGRK